MSPAENTHHNIFVQINGNSGKMGYLKIVKRVIEKESFIKKKKLLNDYQYNITMHWLFSTMVTVT
jgi:hypothetical protein